MQHKDTSQQAFFNYVFNVYFIINFHLVDLGEFSPRLRLMSDSEVKMGAFTFGFETLPHRVVCVTSLFLSVISLQVINEI